MAKKCISCKNELDEKHRFCWRCGQRVFVGVNIPGVEVKQIIFCSYCGKEHPDKARFCMECGKELVDEETRKRALKENLQNIDSEETEFVELTEDVDISVDISDDISEPFESEEEKKGLQKIEEGRIETKEETIYEKVVKSLSDNNINLQDKKKLVNSLSEPPYDETKVKALEYAIGNKDAQIRECAVHALGKIGSADNALAKQIINVLSSATLDKDKFTRIEALKSICTISEVSKTCSQVSASAVTNALKDPDAGVRYRAVIVINSIFQFAPLFFKDAIPLLEKIRDTDPMQINKTEASNLLEKLNKTIEEIEKSKEEAKNIPLEVEPITTPNVTNPNVTNPNVNPNVTNPNVDENKNLPFQSNSPQQPPKPMQSGWLRFRPLKKEK